MSGAMTATELRDRLEAAAKRGIADNFHEFLTYLGHEVGKPIELQALNVPNGYAPKNHFAHATDSRAATRLLAEMEEKAPASYAILNAVDPAVATRAIAGQWHIAEKGQATSDNDIQCRRAAYVDIDADRPKGTSATDAELALVFEVAAAVRGYLVGKLGGAGSIGDGMSGNGAALFVALDNIEESPELAALIKGSLAALKARFEKPGTVIDTSVTDAKRLCPAFGTMKRKGAAGIPERPHRRTGFASAPSVKRLTLAEFKALFESIYADLTPDQRAGVDKAMGKRPAPKTSTSTPPQGSEPDVFALANGCDIAEVLAWQGKIDGDYPVCPGCGTTGNSSVAIVANGLKCSHASCADKGRAGFRTPVDVVVEVEGCSPIEAVRKLGVRFGFEVADRNRPKADDGQTSPPAPGGDGRRSEQSRQAQYDLATVPERLRDEGLERKLIAARRLSFGVRYLDDALGGIFPHDLVLLGAKTGAGKTQLAAVVAQSNAAKGKRVVFLALEAEPKEIERRMKYRTLARLFYAASGGNVALSYRGWYMGEHEQDLAPFAKEADALLMRDFASMRTLYRGRGFGVADVGKVMRQIHEEGGADLVIIDHLHYIDGRADDTETGAQKAIVQAIRDCSLETGIPVIVVAHLRKADRMSKRLLPELEDFMGSSDIGKVATKAIMLAPAPEDPGAMNGARWQTYMCCPKDRMDGGMRNYAATLIYDAREGGYRDLYAIGRLVNGGEAVKPLAPNERPRWATGAT